MTETTWVSFGTLSVSIPLKTLPLSSQHRPCFLFASWWLNPFPQHRSGLWNSDFSSFDQYEVSQQFSIVDNSVSNLFEQFPDHTMPSQCDVVRISVILTCTILRGSGLKAFHSLIFVHDPISHRNHGHRHSAKSYWPNRRVPVVLHTLQLHGNTRRSCTQFVFLVRIGRIVDLVALRHLLFSGSLTACWEDSSRLTQSSHQAYRNQENYVALWSIAI